jgi:hypothetical protein
MFPPSITKTKRYSKRKRDKELDIIVKQESNGANKQMYELYNQSI